MFSPVGEHAGSRPKRFTLSLLASGVVIGIDWLCCSRHFVFFQLSIGCLLNLLLCWFFFFTSALVQIPTHIAQGAGACTALHQPALHRGCAQLAACRGLVPVTWKPVVRRIKFVRLCYLQKCVIRKGKEICSCRKTSVRASC